jgi:hypothetical protein
MTSAKTGLALGTRQGSTRCFCPVLGCNFRQISNCEQKLASSNPAGGEILFPARVDISHLRLISNY